MLFFSIYLLRYVQIRNLRQIECEIPLVRDTVWITRQGTVQGKYVSIESGKYQLNFSQTQAPTIGELVEVIGEIKDRSQCIKSSQIVLIVQSYHTIDKNTLSPFSLLHYPVVSFEVFSNRYLRSTEGEMYRFLPAQHVHILLGMTIGRKYSSQENIALAMKAAGLTHVLVASGANIALLIQFTQAVMRKIYSRKTILFVSLIVAGVYAIVVGNQAPIVRAFLMFSFVSMASLLGRKITWFYPLLLGGFLLLIYQPLFIFSLSFWLTIAASTAVLVSARDQEPEMIGNLAGMYSEFTLTFKSTFLVFLFTTPLLLYTFGQTTFASLLSSVLLLWLVGPITIIGLLSILTLWAIPMATHGLFYLILWFLLEIFIRSVDLISTFTFLSFSLTALTVPGLICYYAILFCWTFLEVAKKRGER